MLGMNFSALKACPACASSSLALRRKFFWFRTYSFRIR